MTPSAIVHAAHGSPVVADATAVCGGCYLCAGSTGRGVMLTDWMGKGFTSQTAARCPWAQHVCEPCAYVTSRVSPVLGREPKEGKAFGGNFRNYSHGSDERGYFNASKGEKPLIRAFLGREHTAAWFLAVADSGQKHVIPFARMNGPGRAGRVLFDEQSVDVPASLALVSAMMVLLTAGVTKDELSGGEYYVRSMKERRAQVEAFEREHGELRGSGWYTLALWLAQRDEVESAERIAKEEARDADRRNGPGPAKRVPARAGRKATAHVLDPDPGSAPECSKADVQRERVGEPDAAAAPHRKPEQGRLKGIG